MYIHVLYIYDNHMLNTCAIIRIYLILIAVRPGIRNGKQKNVLPNNFFVTI